jgi:hypothetical protein
MIRGLANDLPFTSGFATPQAVLHRWLGSAGSEDLMRTNLNRLALALALLPACNHDEPAATAKTTAQASAAASLGSPRPELGGNLLALGEYRAELAIQSDGLVRALVFDAQGQRVAKPESLTLSLSFSTQAGKKLDLALAWHDARACFWGQVEPKGELGLGPIDVSLGVGGQVFAGTLSQYALLPAPRFGGQVIATGGFAVELVATPELVSAYVLDSAGKAVTRLDLDLKLAVGAGASSELALKWDAPSMSYRTALDGKLDLQALPLRLALTADGKLHVGATQSLRAIADVRADAALKLASAGRGNIAVDAPEVEAGLAARAKASAAADAKARAKANATVKVPKPTAKAEAKKSASAQAGAGGVKAGAKASFGFGVK